MKKLVKSGLTFLGALATVAVLSAAPLSEAHADGGRHHGGWHGGRSHHGGWDRGHHSWGHRDRGWHGAGFGLGVLTGAALFNRPHYYAPPRYYYPRPVHYAPAYYPPYGHRTVIINRW